MENADGGHKGWGRFLQGVGKVWQELSPVIPRVPLEEIDERTVAKVIGYNLDNPRIRLRLQKDAIFTITSVLANMGYTKWTHGDYQERYPKEYTATRAALQKLTTKGLLAMGSSDEPDEDGERTFYQVPDMERLRGIADLGKGQKIKPHTD